MNKSPATLVQGTDGNATPRRSPPSIGAGVEIKQDIACALNKVLDDLRISQTAIAHRLGIRQPHVSAIRNYKLEGFSSERLLELLSKLGASVTIAIAPPRSSASTRITVKSVGMIPSEEFVFNIGIFSSPPEIPQAWSMTWPSSESSFVHFEQGSFAHLSSSCAAVAASTAACTNWFRTCQMFDAETPAERAPSQVSEFPPSCQWKLAVR
ncbi:putative XRE-type DNA-binding protein [Tahibacter aquaticus]|uniref:Putative XRE-type DNA-binding protein n=1 Tax=Tahibacter aquaticus TaxID=520092 RepID=A0A4R6YRA0_9GAMM|nr:helix-turn-helix transcriptional regulator [Tahibacter aquaticus]TDR40480.1 putative XRE-type DNA-binding protein [Tahibacter aquaticus]